MCKIFLKFTKFINIKVELVVRSLNPENHFNLQNSKCLDYFKFICMEYYLSIVYLLQNDHTSFQIEDTSDSKGFNLNTVQTFLFLNNRNIKNREVSSDFYYISFFSLKYLLLGPFIFTIVKF